MRRANKYRYSLEKHCYDTYCTVYRFAYFNKCLTNKSGVTLTAMYILYNKTKLKIYSNVHVPVFPVTFLSVCINTDYNIHVPYVICINTDYNIHVPYVMPYVIPHVRDTGTLC